MRKHRCPGSVKVARFPGMSDSGSIPVSGLLLIFVVFTLCLPCYSFFLSACTVKRGAASTAMPPNLNRKSPANYTLDHTILLHLCVLIVG